MKENMKNICLWVSKKQLTKKQEEELRLRWMIEEIEIIESMELASESISFKETEESVDNWNRQLLQLIEKHKATVIAGDWPLPMFWYFNEFKNEYPLALAWWKKNSKLGKFVRINDIEVKGTVTWAMNVLMAVKEWDTYQTGAVPPATVVYGNVGNLLVKSWSMDFLHLSKPEIRYIGADFHWTGEDSLDGESNIISSWAYCCFIPKSPNDPEFKGLKPIKFEDVVKEDDSIEFKNLKKDAAQFWRWIRKSQLAE